MNNILDIFNKYYIFIFIIVIFLNNLIPKKIRGLFLLVISLLFTYFMSFKLIIYMIITILSIYLSALIIDNINDKKNSVTDKEIKKIYIKRKKLVFIICIAINILFLFIFKYLKFFTINTNHILSLFHIDYQFEVMKLIAPIGISFYTLKALSYLVDVYREKIKASKNFIKVSLFISFFPEVIEGPISRFENIHYLSDGNKIKYRNLCFGLQRVTFGLFKKMVIADRIHIAVKQIFDNYNSVSGITIFIGALFYTIMLYMEFSSMMDIVLGIFEILGIKAEENFRQPFFSKTISEFWTRWHITLGQFFKDYIYYPITMSKKIKRLTLKLRKKLGSYYGPLIGGSIALFAVWFLNGLWHGAGYTYILFGMYHFMLIFLENLLKNPLEKLYKKVNFNQKFYRVFQSLKVFILVIFGELIFLSTDLNNLFVMIKKLFTNLYFDKNMYALLSLDILDYIVLILALLLVFVVSIYKEKNINIREKISNQNIFVRWAIYYLLIFAIIILGAYGSNYSPVEAIYRDF